MLTPQQMLAKQLQLQGKSQREIAREMGISRRTVRVMLKRAEDKVHDPAVQKAMDHFGTGMEPNTIWLKDKSYSVQLMPKKQTPAEFLDLALQAFQNIPPAPAIEPPSQILADLMTVYPFYDVHLGLRAHAAISGTEMNLEIGIQRVRNAMIGAMSTAPASRRAVLINGGDFTHQTDDLNRTRKSGHILDVDGRNVMTVLAAIEVISHSLEMALTKHDEVEYYSVPGNHDPQNWETILIGLRERYRNHDRIRINFELKELSCVEHGEVAIFIHHGDKRPPKDLAMLCSARYPEVWGRTRFRIVMTGHLHHLKADEFPGIYWMQLPALTVPDGHAASGYQSHSLMKAITYDLVSEVISTTVKM